MPGRFASRSLVFRSLIFGAVLFGLIGLSLFSAQVTSADGTIPGVVDNVVIFTNNINLPDGVVNAASPQGPVAVDICNQPAPVSDGLLVEALAGIAFGESRKLDGLPNNNYEWQVTVAGTDCGTVLGNVDRARLINGDEFEFTLEVDAQGTLQVSVEVIKAGGGIIYLPLASVQ